MTQLRPPTSAKINKVLDEATDSKVVAPAVLDELSPAHLLQLEVLSREIEISKLQSSLKEQEIKIKLQEQKLVAFELSDLQRQMMQAVTYHAGKIKVRTSLIHSIKDLYGFTDNFGYDPETGKITRA